MGNGAVRSQRQDADGCLGAVPSPEIKTTSSSRAFSPDVYQGVDTGDVTLAVAREFLQNPYQGHRETVQSLLDTVAAACWGTAYFYSVPGGRGRNVVVRGSPGQDREKIVLAACSDRSAKLGEVAPEDHLTSICQVLESPDVADLCRDVSRHSSKTSRMPHSSVAAAVVRTLSRDASSSRILDEAEESVEGVLVVEVPFDLAQKVRDRLLANLQLWSLLLQERIEKNRWQQDAETSTRALNNMLQSMEEYLEQEKLALAMQEACALMPSPMISGGIESSRIGLWFRDENDLVLNDTGHLDGIRVPVDQSIVGYAVSTHADQIVFVPDVTNDERHYKKLDDKTGFFTSSTICVPLPKPQQKKKQTNREVVVQFVNGGHDPQEARPFDHFDVVAAERLQQSALPTTLWLRDNLMQIISKEQERVLVEAIMRGLQHATTVVDLVEIIERDLADLVDAACCTVFFVDVEQGHVWCPPGHPETRPNGIKVDLGQGLAGHLAKAALDGDQSGVVITNDPPNCPYWKGDQPNSSFRTRNIMTVPVWSTGTRQLLGIVQVLNKTETTKRRRGSFMEQSRHSIHQVGGFTPIDARMLEALAVAIGHHLQRMLVDLMWTKTRLDTGMQEAAPSMLSEYYDEKVGPKDDGKLLRQRSVAFDRQSSAGDSLSSPRQISPTNQAQRDLILQIRGFGPLGFDSLEPSDEIDIQKWRVDYFTLSEKDEFVLLKQALQDHNLMKEFGLDANVLYNFFVQVKDAYLDCPYHNFRHAISTLHYTFKLLEASGAGSHLYKNDLFAILIGAMCHDIGHRGRNTAFEVMTHSDLALRYNDNSPLENYHCARAFEIAQNGTEATSCNIFQSMTAETFCAVRKMMIAGILGTDMRFHGDHVKVAQDLSTSFPKKEFEPVLELSLRQTIVEIFLHSADISNVCMPADIAKRWNALLAQEFHAQAKEELACGIPATPFMQGMDNPLVAAKSSLGFMDFVVNPLVIPLVRTFPDLAPVKDHLEQNREEAIALIAKLS